MPWGWCSAVLLASAFVSWLSRRGRCRDAFFTRPEIAHREPASDTTSRFDPSGFLLPVSSQKSALATRLPRPEVRIGGGQTWWGRAPQLRRGDRRRSFAVPDERALHRHLGALHEIPPRWWTRSCCAPGSHPSGRSPERLALMPLVGASRCCSSPVEAIERVSSVLRRRLLYIAADRCPTCTRNRRPYARSELVGLMAGIGADWPCGASRDGPEVRGTRQRAVASRLWIRRRLPYGDALHASLMPLAIALV